MKRKGLFVFALPALLSLGALAGTPARLTARKIELPKQPSAVEDVTRDEDGHLYLLDRSHPTVLEYDSTLRFMRTIGGPAKSQGGLMSPLNISTAAGLLAVVDGNSAIRFYSTKTGKYLFTTYHLVLYNPAAGCFITPKRIVFDFMGFEGPKPARGKPLDILTFFTTDLHGKHLEVGTREHVPVLEIEPYNIFGIVSWTRWGKNRWVCTRQLPRHLIMLDKNGKIIRTSDSKPAKLPDGRPKGNPTLPHFYRVLFSAPHVDGIFPVGPRLGVIWRPKPSARVPLRIEWMDEKLHTTGYSDLVLPDPMAYKDFVKRAVNLSDGRILVLVVRRKGYDLGRSDLYVFKVPAEGKRVSE